MDDIFSKLRERELQTVSKQLRGSEFYEKQVKSRAECAKEVLGGESINKDVPVEVVAIRDLYRDMLKSYSRISHLPTSKMNNRSIALWKRVEDARKRANVPQDLFLKAQFEWFHRAFGTPPDPVQLATDNAVERATAYKGTAEYRTVTNNIEHKPDLIKKFKQSEKLLQKMLASQKCTREEFYKRFVLTGVYTFPSEFLELDPVWQKVSKT